MEIVFLTFVFMLSIKTCTRTAKMKNPHKILILVEKNVSTALLPTQINVTEIH